VGGIDHQWQGDLVELGPDISRKNGGNRYILTVIDVFSKFAWAILVRRKNANEVLDAFKRLIFEAAPRKPKRLQTDKGKEFMNSKVQAYLASLGIKHFASNSDMKAAVVERFNRTLKTRMYAYFTANNTKRFIETLPKLLHSYNYSYHRTIKMKPAYVKHKDEPRLWNLMYGRDAAIGSYSKVKTGQETQVRINKVKTIFDKGYLPNWSEEVFNIVGDIPHQKRVYKLKDRQDTNIGGTYYPEEIQPIKKEFIVEKVLKARKTSKGDEVLVKWQDYPAKFNSWINS
jgi:hypothetical protein